MERCFETRIKKLRQTPPPHTHNSQHTLYYLWQPKALFKFRISGFHSLRCDSGGYTAASLVSEKAWGVYTSLWSVWCREERPLCLSDPVMESSAFLLGTCSSLSLKQDEQHPAHQMVICPSSHLCCIPDSLQPTAVSSTHAARQFLPTTLPNGSSLKVMGCPDRLAPPSAAAFGKEIFPFLALPLGCIRAFLPGE